MENNTPMGSPEIGEEKVNNVIQLTPDHFKRAKAMQRTLTKKAKHEKNLEKKREERWNQPFADAKIEDVRHVVNYIQGLEYEVGILRQLLLKKEVVTEAEIEETKKYNNERLEVFNKLKTDASLSEADKRTEAAKWNIPLVLLGLEPEEPAVTTQDGDDISEIVEPVEPGLF